MYIYISGESKWQWEKRALLKYKELHHNLLVKCAFEVPWNRYVSIDMCIYICMHVYIYVQIHMCICSEISIYVYIFIYTELHCNLLVRIRSLMEWVCINIHSFSYLNICLYG
jgi:hypothetical protein